jgi:hypothetical protein
MTRILGALGALLSLLLAAPPAVASPDAEGSEAVVYYDLYEATVEPRLVHSAVNASPRIRVRTWRHWGAATAVGRGTWVSTCASCAPPRTRRAVVTLSRIRTCDDGTRHYSRIVVEVGRPDRGGTRTTYRLSTGCPPPPVA